MEESYKQLEQSVQKLLQLEAENLVIREENSTFNTAEKQTKFPTRVRPMHPLNTLSEGGNTIWHTPPLNGEPIEREMS